MEEETTTTVAAAAPKQGGKSTVVAMGASSLEDYLLGGGLPAPAEVPTSELMQTPTSQANLTGMGMGGFVAELKDMLPRAGPKKVSVTTPVQRRPAEK